MYQKVTFLYLRELLWNIPTEILTNQEGQNMHQIFFGALDHQIVSFLSKV